MKFWPLLLLLVVQWAPAESVKEVGSARLGLAEKTIVLSQAQIERLEIAWQKPKVRRFFPVARAFARVVPLPTTLWHLETPLPGRIDEVTVLPGQQVERGEALLVLSSPKLLALEEQLLLAEREWQTVRHHYTRLKPLAEKGALPRGEWLEVEKRWQEAHDRYYAAQGRLLQLGYTRDALQKLIERGRAEGKLTFRAPRAGWVEAFEIKLGQWVVPGAPLLKFLPQGASLWLEVVLPADLAANIQPGDRIRWSEGTAIIAQKVPTIDPESQTQRFYARPAKSHIRIGELLTVTVEHHSATPLWQLPPSAIIRHDGRFWLFSHSKRGFEPIAIAPHAFSQEGVYVVPLAGVSEVVTSGATALKSIWLEEE